MFKTNVFIALEGGDYLNDEYNGYLSGNYVQMYCPNCGAKVAGLKGQDGAIRIECSRCGVKIFSKQKNAKEVDIKIKSSH